MNTDKLKLIYKLVSCNNISEEEFITLMEDEFNNNQPIVIKEPVEVPINTPWPTPYQPTPVWYTTPTITCSDQGTTISYHTKK